MNDRQLFLVLIIACAVLWVTARQCRRACREARAAKLLAQGADRKADAAHVRLDVYGADGPAGRRMHVVKLPITAVGRVRQLVAEHPGGSLATAAAVIAMGSVTTMLLLPGRDRVVDSVGSLPPPVTSVKAPAAAAVVSTTTVTVTTTQTMPASGPAGRAAAAVLALDGTATTVHTAPAAQPAPPGPPASGDQTPPPTSPPDSPPTPSVVPRVEPGPPTSTTAPIVDTAGAGDG